MEKVNDRLYSWASDIEPDTIEQAAKTSRLPIVEDHVALMPDAHVGIGATVGSVIATKGAVIPAAVGVDIGCGMIAAELPFTANHVPDDLNALLAQISRSIPAGVGKGHGKIRKSAEQWYYKNPPASDISYKKSQAALEQFGTLGSGNHFFELCLDERDVVWVVLHSGSRGVGNQLASDHIKTAKGLERNLNAKLEDPDLAYFLEGEPEFQAYIGDMLWAQSYAFANRHEMMRGALRQVWDAFMGRDTSDMSAEDRYSRLINCHHNFTERETHGDKKLWITRKGAIKADVNDYGVIPGSMGTRSYIVKGKGNTDSWKSCSHGAGRRMSRGEAKRRFNAADLMVAMQGKTWQQRDAQQLIDEIPASYKDIDQVMDDQKDLVEIEHTLHQVLNYKGTK